MTGAPLIPDAIESPDIIEPDAIESPDFVESVARQLYDRETRQSLFRCVPWDALDADERDDLRHRVRSVLAVVALRRSELPTSPGLIGLPPPLVTGPGTDDAAGDEAEHWLRTGT